MPSVPDAEAGVRPERAVPDGADRFVVTHKSIDVSRNKLEALPDDELEALDIDVPPASESRFENQSVAINEGDELPPTLAREVYPAFGDHIAVYDADGERLDADAGPELQTGPTIPDGAVEFRMNGNDLRVSPSRVRDLEPEVRDEYGLPDPDEVRKIIIEDGESIPPDIAASVYGAFNDTIAVYGAEGQRLA